MIRSRLREVVQAFRDAFANANVRRLQLAWAGSILGEWTYRVVLLVYAYEVGGASTAAVAGLILAIPAAIASPLTGVLADRYRRESVLMIAELARAFSLGLAAVAVVAGAPAAVVFALAGLETVFATAFRPAQAALLPALTATPEQLTASNVVASTIESVATLVGPALGGLLLAATSAGVVFAVMAGTFVWSMLLIVRIQAPDRAEAGLEVSPQARLAELGAGFRTALLDDRRLRLLFGLTGAQTLVAGALNILIVALALDLLDMGDAGPGLLTSAIGVGAVVGTLPAALLVGRRLSPAVGLGLLAWGLPIALIGAWPEQIVALLALALLGAADVVGFVASQTLIQRVTDEKTMARVFGVLESFIIATVGVGGILGSVLIAELGIRGALAATGGLMSGLVLLYWRRLMRIDAELLPHPAAASVDLASPIPGVMLPGVEPPLRDIGEE